VDIFDRIGNKKWNYWQIGRKVNVAAHGLHFSAIHYKIRFTGR
jgi:hypothetical protein